MYHLNMLLCAKSGAYTEITKSHQYVKENKVDARETCILSEKLVFWQPIVEAKGLAVNVLFKLPLGNKVIDPDKVHADQNVGLFYMCHLKSKKQQICCFSHPYYLFAT